MENKGIGDNFAGVDAESGWTEVGNGLVIACLNSS